MLGHLVSNAGYGARYGTSGPGWLRRLFALLFRLKA